MDSSRSRTLATPTTIPATVDDSRNDHFRLLQEPSISRRFMGTHKCISGMCVIVEINVVITRKEVPGAVGGPFGAPVSFHCCEGGVELVFVVRILSVAVSVGERPEHDGDGPDDVAVLGVYCARFVVRVAEGVVGRGVECVEGAAGEIDAGGEAVEGVLESCGRTDILFWMVPLRERELAGRSSWCGICR